MSRTSPDAIVNENDTKTPAYEVLAKYPLHEFLVLTFRCQLQNVTPASTKRLTKKGNFTKKPEERIH